MRFGRTCSGVIDKVRGGKVVASLSPKDATTGTTFISCSDQLTCQNDKNVHGAHANYLIRSDGVAERMVGLSTEPQLMVRMQLLAFFSTCVIVCACARVRLCVCARGCIRRH